MKVKDVAKVLGKSEKTIRDGLQMGVYPFGVAFKPAGSTKYTYTFFPAKLDEYIGGNNNGQNGYRN